MSKPNVVVNITVGTTPTITYRLKKVTPSILRTADFTVKDRTKTTIIERHIDTATLDATNNTIGWKLTQQETFLLKLGQQYTMMANWLTNDGTAGVTEKATILPESNHRTEVIT